MGRKIELKSKLQQLVTAVIMDMGVFLGSEVSSLFVDGRIEDGEYILCHSDRSTEVSQGVAFDLET